MPTTVETQNPKQDTDLKDLAQDVVARAMAGGATTAEAVVREGDDFSTVVRLGQVETLKEAGSKSVGVRVFYGNVPPVLIRVTFRARHRSHAEVRARTREDHFRGSVRRDP